MKKLVLTKYEEMFKDWINAHKAYRKASVDGSYGGVYAYIHLDYNRIDTKSLNELREVMKEPQRINKDGDCYILKSITKSTSGDGIENATIKDGYIAWHIEMGTIFPGADIIYSCEWNDEKQQLIITATPDDENLH